MKKSKDKEKKPHLSFGRVVSNNIYLLSLYYGKCLEPLIINIVETAVYAFLNFLTGTYLLRVMINGYQTGRSFGSIAAFLIAVLLSQGVIYIVSELYWDLRGPRLNAEFDRCIKLRLFKKTAEVELACFENPAFFDKYVKAMNTAASRAQDVMRSVMQAVRMIVTVAANAALVLSVDPWLLLFAIPPLVINFIFSKKRNEVNYECTRKVDEEKRQRDYTRRTFYQIDFAKEMRTTRIHRVMFRRYSDTMKRILALYKKYGPSIVFFDALVRSSLWFGIDCAVYFYTAFRVLVTKTMLLGDCAVVSGAVNTVSYTIQDGVDTAVKFHEHALYIEDVRKFLDYEPKLTGSVRSALRPGTPAPIALRDVSFRYEGSEHDVLRHLNLEIHAGEKIAVVGHNGAGKSTLAKLLLRLYDPTEGRIEFAGQDVSTLEPSDYREHFGMVFQDFKLFAMSVRDNVMLRPPQDGDDALCRRSLELAGAAERVDKLPQGAKTTLTREFDDEGAVLSGGEGQKLSIARVFAKNCSVVILDEPTSALDPIAEYKMYENMMRACEGKTVVMISHRMSSAILADRICLIENGEIAEFGTHRELMHQGGRYAEMFSAQAENYRADLTGKGAAM